MTLRRRFPALAVSALLTCAIATPAHAQSHGSLRIAVRIVNDCDAATPAAAGQPQCPPAQQRSDAVAPVPPQVQALTPAAPANDARVDRVTVTF